MSRFVATLVEAAKVGVLVWGALCVDDTVKTMFPTLPDGVRYFAAAMVGALVLELVIAIVLGVPRVQVQWFAGGDGEELQMIDIASTRRAMASGPYTVKVVIPYTGWLGRIALWAFVPRGSLMRIRVPNAPVKPFVENADEYDSLPTVTADDSSRGFVINLGSDRPRSGEWRWAEVRWQLTRLPEEPGKYNIDHVLDHPNLFRRLLIKLFIRKPRLVKKLRVRRK